MRGTRVGLLALAFAAALAALTACGSSAKSSSSGGTAPGLVQGGGGTDTPAGPTQAGGSATTAPAADRSVIYTAKLEVRTADVAAVARQATAVAERHGGLLSDQELVLDRPARATLTLRVPPDQLTATLDELSGLGKEGGRTQQAQDVTADVVDVDSRIKSGDASVARLRDLVAKATTVTDIAALEAELARRESDLEALKARQRALSAQVARATITLSITEPSSESAVRKIPGIGDALAAGGKAFWTVLKALLVAVAWSLPFLGAAVVLVVPLRRLGRRRRARRARRPPTTRGPSPGGPLPPPG